MTVRCPCCLTVLAEGTEVPMDALRDAPISPMQRMIVEKLISAYPRQVSRAELIETLYGHDARGGPDNPMNIISVMLHKLRKQLPQFGWTVGANTRIPGVTAHSGYRLVKVP